MFYLPNNFQSTKTAPRTCDACAQPAPPTQSCGPKADTSCSCSSHSDVLWVILAGADEVRQRNPAPALVHGHFLCSTNTEMSPLQPCNNARSRKKSLEVNIFRGLLHAHWVSNQPDKYPRTIINKKYTMHMWPQGLP